MARQRVTGIYRIDRQSAKNRVIISFDGPRDYVVEEFWNEFQEAVQFVKSARSDFDVLVDHSKSTLMSPERTAYTEDMARWCSENGLRKSANIVPSPVMRMQLERVTARDKPFGFFATREEAENWLDEA